MMREINLAPNALTPEQREQMLAELRRVDAEDTAAAREAEDVTAPLGLSEPPPPDPDDDGLGDELDRLVPYTLPSGKLVWVGALSSEDYRTLFRATAHIPPPAPRPGDTEATISRLRDAYAAHIRPYMVALCCYKSDEKTAGNLRWPLDGGGPQRIRAKMSGLVQVGICTLSDSIAAGVDETERLKGFFTSIRTCLTSWSSACGSSDALPPGLAAETARLAGLCERAASLGKLPPERGSLSGTSGSE